MEKKKTSVFGMLFNMFFGRQKKVLSLLEEERVQSPGKTVAKEFFKRKLTIIGLIGFFTILMLSIVLPIFFPLVITDIDMGQFNQSPSRNMMQIPRDIRGEVAMIGAGPGYGIGVTTNNEIHFWGTVNIFTGDLDTPPVVSRPIVHVSAGDYHALVVTECGYVYSWGDQTALFAIHNVPAHLQGRIVTAEASRRFTIAITDEGRPVGWGNRPSLDRTHFGRFPAGLTAVQVDVNWLTGGVLSECGRLYILLSTSRDIRYVPDEIQGRIIDFAMTNDNAAAVLDDGTVTVWGSTMNRELMNVPEYIQGRVREVHGGRDHFTALLDDGTVASWGYNMHGRTNAPNVSNAVSIAVGGDHNYVFLADGSIRTWGLRGFLFGTDEFGRCVFTRMWHAGRYSLLIGFVAVFVSGFIGIIFGGLAGFYGGKVDMVLMRFAEAVSSLPFLPIAMILSWRFSDMFGPVGGMMALMVVLGALSWPGLMFIVRGQIFQAKESEYVLAARVLGVKQFKIIARHILPNISSVVIVSLTLSLAGSMLTESALSFIGFGIQEPTPTWGNMLTGIGSMALRVHWWRWVFPAIALVTVAISINLVGDGLREATDPRTQGR